MWRRVLALLVLASAVPYLLEIITWWSGNEPALVAFSWMMPIVAVVACWLRFRGSERRDDTKPARHWLPLTMGLLGVGFALGGWVLDEPIVSATGLWLAIASALGLAIYPWLSRPYLLPLSPLVLTAPLTRDFPANVEQWLQRASTVVGGFWMSILGLEVERDGLLLITSRFHTVVDETCSGINTLTALTVYCLLLGLILRVRDRGILLLGFLALPTSIVLNGLRIAWIAILGERGGTELAMGPMHGIAGFVSFFVGYALLLVGLVLLRKRQGATVPSNNDEDQRQPGDEADPVPE